MKALDDSDFRSKRFMLEKEDFALASGEYPGPIDLVEKGTWESIVALPDDVSIRTSDRYGSQLEQIWDYWGEWTRVVRGVQSLSTQPAEFPTAIAAGDASDELQAATYAALVGYYRVAFSCLRNVLEQLSIAAQLVLSGDKTHFADWRSGQEKIKFGWAADMLPKNAAVTNLEQYLRSVAADDLFSQSPKGLARRFFIELSKHTHGTAGFTDGDFRQSNGPIFLPKIFLSWCVAALKTYAIALHLLKLVHPQLNVLPWGPRDLTIDDFRAGVVAKIPANDQDRVFFESLVDFWHP